MIWYKEDILITLREFKELVIVTYSCRNTNPALTISKSNRYIVTVTGHQMMELYTCFPLDSLCSTGNVASISCISSLFAE